jgi:hypothetical protein
MKTKLFFQGINHFFPIVIFLIYFLFLQLPLPAQSLKSIKNEAYTHGEKLKFRAYYDSFLTGKVTAGIATLEVEIEDKFLDGRPVYKIIGEGFSRGAFNWFFKVEDRFESYIDEEFLVPWLFIRRTHEGDYMYNDDVRFNQFTGAALSTRANKKIPIGTFDILSAFYYARTLDFSKALPGDIFPISFYLDDSLYLSQIQFAGREEVIIDLGHFKCLRFKPMVAKGNVFSQPYPMDIWVTDDKNHLPVLARSAVIVGAVKLELIHYKGLVNPLTSLVVPEK